LTEKKFGKMEFLMKDVVKRLKKDCYLLKGSMRDHEKEKGLGITRNQCGFVILLKAETEIN
jgi:hypothetical protein